MKKFANESKLNIKIAEQSGSFAKELIIAVLSFFISLSFLNLAYSSLALQKEGFSMIAVMLSLVLIAVFEIALSSSDEKEEAGAKAKLKQYGFLIVVAILLVATIVLHKDFGEVHILLK